MARVAMLVAGTALFLLGLATSVPDALMNGASPLRVLGFVAAVAGLGAGLVALRGLLRGRRRRTWAGAAILALVAVQWLVVPAVNAGLVTHAPRGAVAAASALGIPGARDVRLTAADGVRIAAWWVPGSRPAAVVLLHGSHGDRSDGIAHLRLLHEAGYGVLALDSRGHGESGGPTNALGWGAERDVAAAVGYLRRLGIAPRSIGALGLSMGAEVALRSAADGVPLAAVVADGAGASTDGDRKLVSRGASAFVADSTSWLAMRGAELVAGVHEPPPLHEVASRIDVPVLLVASGRHDELALDRAYRAAIGPAASVWSVPDAGHTRALVAHPQAYAAHVVAFLDASLSVR